MPRQIWEANTLRTLLTGGGANTEMTTDSFGALHGEVTALVAASPLSAAVQS